MTKGRRVSFYAMPGHILLVGEWLVNNYRPASTILSDVARDYQDAQHARVIGGWLLDQLSQGRRFKHRPLGIVLPPLALKWLALNLPSWHRSGISPLHGPLGCFGARAGAAVRRRGRPSHSIPEKRERASKYWMMTEKRQKDRLRSELKRHQRLYQLSSWQG